MTQKLAPLFAVAAAAVLVACAPLRPSQVATENNETVIEQTLKGSPEMVSACLRANGTRASYPRGYPPSFVFEQRNGAGLLLEQWFDSGNESTWTTSFDLQPSAGNTVVKVTMPYGLNLAKNYTRAARELVSWCEKAQA